MSSRADALALLETLRLVLASGVDPVVALSASAVGMRDSASREALMSLSHALTAGRPLVDGLDALEPILGPQAVAVLSAGLRRGDPERAIERARATLSRQGEERSLARSVLVYPGLVLVTSVGLGTLLALTLLPQLAALERDLGAPRRSGSALLALLGGHPWLLSLPLLVPLATWLVLRSSDPRGPLRVAVDRLRLDLPILGRLERLSAAIAVSGLGSDLLAAGLAAPEVFRELEARATNRYVGRLLGTRAARAGDGRDAAGLFMVPEVMPKDCGSMFRRAGGTGGLPAALGRVHDELRLRYEMTIEGARGPARLLGVVLATLIALAFLAVFGLPLFSLATGAVE